MKTKKALLFGRIILCLISFSLPCKANAANRIKLDDPLRLNDMVLTLLMPHIKTAVEAFYEPYLTITPNVATYYASEIIDIIGGENINEGVYNSSYTVTVVVHPYVGPHLSVGTDRLIFTFNPIEISLKEYAHLESHTLPPHYQSSIKKPLP